MSFHCEWCGRYVYLRGCGGQRLLALQAPNGDAHAAHCPKRVRSVQLGRVRDPVQKLIPAAAIPREPITIKAKRAR